MMLMACSASAGGTNSGSEPDAATDHADAPAPDFGGCYVIGQDPNPAFTCTPGCWYREGSRIPYHGPIAGVPCVRTCLVSGQLSPDCMTPPDAGTTGECAVGATRHCYSGPTRTEGIGQCHGATQTCYRGVDGDGHWPSLTDCVGEVTPNSAETPYDAIDNDCNGIVDDDARLLTGHVPFCYREQGCFWFGSEPDYYARSTYGEQGCYTSGHFRALTGPIVPGMFITAGEQGHVHIAYYIGRDNRRYYIPNAAVFGSWFIDATSTERFDIDAHGCASIVQVTPAQLAAIQIGGNVTLRPGTVATGITTDPRRYVISRGGVLRPLADEALLFELQPRWINPHVVMTPDYLFVNYSVGTTITNASTYNWSSEIGITLDQNLGLTP